MSHLSIPFLLIFLSFGVAHALPEQAGEKTDLIKPAITAETKDAKPTAAVPLAANSLNQTATTPTEKIVKLATPATDGQTERILNSLAEQAGWFPELTLSVKDGMVTIKGRTKDSAHLEWLAKTADRLPNVVAVINQAEIEIPPASDFTPVFNESRALLEKAKRALPRIGAAALLLIFFYFINRRLSKFVYSLWGRSISNSFLHGTVTRLTMLPIWLLFFYLGLQVAGLQSLATTIIGGTGAVGLILGFAFKDIMSNYFSGILLAIRSPFTKGDNIQIGDYAGFIQSLSMRGTTIIDGDGNLILIPNATVTQSVIINKSVNQKKRTFFYVGISYRDSVQRAIEIIESVLQSFPEILSEPKALVYIEKFSENQIDIKVFFWFDESKSSGDTLKSLALGRIREKLLADHFTLPAGLQYRIVQNLTNSESITQITSQERTPTSTQSKGAAGDHDQELKRISQGVDIMRKTDRSTFQET